MLPRFDGRPAEIDPGRRIMPYIMRGRNESAVYFEQTIDVTAAQEWLAAYNARGGAKATIFHLVLFGLSRMLHERPRLNRFAVGRKIYDRDGVYLSFAAKKERSDDAPLVTVKREFSATEGFERLVNGLFSSVVEARSDRPSASDKEVDLLLRLPRPALDGAVSVMRWLDGWGMVPPQLLRGDPMFTSAFVSNLGSLKLDSVFHHLYEYGNCPLFVAIGQVKTQAMPTADGSGVEVRPTVTLKWTYDERIEDGLYAGSSIEIVRRAIEDPASCIDVPLQVTAPEPKPPMTRSPMRQVDQMGAVYLAAENSRVCTHTAALTVLDPSDAPDGALTLDTLRRLVEQRLHLIPPFRWRLATVPFGLDHGYWYDDPDFDIDFHLRELALPAPGTDEQLKEQIARLFTRPLDRSRPLWEMYLIQGLEGGRVALLTKMHHAIVDGVSGAEVMGTLFGLSPEVEEYDAPPAPLSVHEVPGEWEMLARGVTGLARKPGQALSTVPGVLANFGELPFFGSLPAAGKVSRLFSSVTGRERPEVARPESVKAPRTSFNGRITAHRRLAFGTLPFEDVKTVKNALGVTVNDVVMTVASAAIRRWLVTHEELPTEPLVAVVPVSVRTKDEAGTYGNKVSAIMVPIPTNVEDPLERVRLAHEAMRAAKNYHDAVPADVLADATQFLPPALLAQAAQAITALAAMPGTRPAMNVNISNVPGPQVPLFCAGSRVESMVPLAGISDGMGLNITVMSYCGRIEIGIVADRDQMPDVQLVADWMVEELDVLVKQVSK